MLCCPSARAGLDTEQLLLAGPALAGDSGDSGTGSWHGCETVAWHAHPGGRLVHVSSPGREYLTL